MSTPIADRIAEVTRILTNPAWEKDQLAGVLRVVKAMGEEVDGARREADAATDRADRERESRKAAERERDAHRQHAIQMERERDLAVAHDRQPYPTAFAYEALCKAHESLRARLALAERVIEISRPYWANMVAPWTSLRDAIAAYDAAKESHNA